MRRIRNLSVHVYVAGNDTVVVGDYVLEHDGDVVATREGSPAGRIRLDLPLTTSLEGALRFLADQVDEREDLTGARVSAQWAALLGEAQTLLTPTEQNGRTPQDVARLHKALAALRGSR